MFLCLCVVTKQNQPTKSSLNQSPFLAQADFPVLIDLTLLSDINSFPPKKTHFTAMPYSQMKCE